MSITDELRKYSKSSDGVLYSAHQAILAIADRIDAEHEAKVSYWQGASYKDGYDEGFASADDWLAQHEDAIAEHGWIRLPKDADGETIYVGDEMCGYGWPNGGVYCRAIVNEVTILVGPQDGAYRGWLMWAANECRHHHAPTVEDVLREFAEAMNENMGMYTGEAIDADEWRMADERTIAKYAAKLRLAEGEDA